MTRQCETDHSSIIVEDSLRQVQLLELELFKKFAGICCENNLNYFALGGTLLGAVRHKGFIPWDDDMDIGLPRPDYEKFLVLCKNGKVPFEYRSFENDKRYTFYPIRVEDSSIKIKKEEFINSEVVSPWIDVFPLDGMPNNNIKRFIWKNYILWRSALLNLSAFSTNVKIHKKNRPFYQRAVIKAAKIAPIEKLLSTEKEHRKLDRALKKFSYAKSNYLVNAMGAWKFKEMFHKKYYGEGAWYDFEDTKIRGPIDYDFVLTQLYGDYMTPPPEDERNHHGIAEIIRSDEEGDTQ